MGKGLRILHGSAAGAPGRNFDPYRVSTRFPFLRISESSEIWENGFESSTKVLLSTFSSPPNKITTLWWYFVRAEMRGFEPLVGLPLRHISSVVPSTTQPRFHILYQPHLGTQNHTIFSRFCNLPRAPTKRRGILTAYELQPSTPRGTVRRNCSGWFGISSGDCMESLLEGARTLA